MRDAIILIFANKQDLPEGKAFLTYCVWREKVDTLEKISSSLKTN